MCRVCTTKVPENTPNTSLSCPPCGDEAFDDGSVPTAIRRSASPEISGVHEPLATDGIATY